jgi:hypothetical protein
MGYSAKEAKAIISKGYSDLRDVESDDNNDNEMLLEVLKRRSDALSN